MKSSLFTATAAFTLAIPLFCAAAHVDQQPVNPTSVQATQSHQATGSANQAVQPHGLTRKQVYDQLVQAEKDGSLARINALYEGS